MGVDQTAPIIGFKSHTFNTKKFGANDHDGMILIVRDFKESITRHYKEVDIINDDEEFFKAFLKETEGYEKPKSADYIACLQAYDIRTAPKMLIYYEDLIQNPKQIVQNLGNFIEASQKDIEAFCDNIAFHKQMSVKNYPTRSFTKGSATKYHQNSLNQSLLIKMTDSLKTRYPDLFTKYLKRYDS